MPVLLQLLLELLGLAVTDLYRINRVICFLQFDRPITDILACDVLSDITICITNRKTNRPSPSMPSRNLQGQKRQ